MRLRVLFYFVFALAVLWASPCWSQTTPRVQVFGGYSYVPNSFSWLGGGANGWNASLDLNAKSTKWLGFTADFGGYSQNQGGENIKTYTFLFGPRFFQPLSPGSRVTIFGHALLGAAHVNARPFSGTFTRTTSFSWAGGAGVDYRIAKHFALRGAADVLYTHFTVGDNQLRINDLHTRLSAGVVVSF